MTLKIMQGFETQANDSDLRSQNVLYPAGSLGLIGLNVASTTGIAGRGLKPISSVVNGTSYGSDAATTSGVSGAPDLGYINTGTTVNQAWTGGGFSFGASAKFWQSPNALNAQRRQMCYDSQNDRYYTIMGAIVYISQDLITWTQCFSQPVGVSASGGILSYMGNGTVMHCSTTTASSAMIVYYTTNNGSTWSQQTIASSGTATGFAAIGCATGNSTYPMMIDIGSFNGSFATNNGIYVGTLGGTWTFVKNIASAYSNQIVTSQPGITSTGLLYHLIQGTMCSVSNVTTANISVASNWVFTTGFDGSTYDVQYFAKGNVWIGASGVAPYIYSMANPGTAGAPLAPTSATRTGITLANSAATIYSMNVLIAGNGNCVVTGGAGSGGQSMYAYSTDGSTWQTKFTVLPNNAVAYTGFNVASQSASYYTSIVGKNGSIVKIGLTSSSNSSSFVAASPDGVNDWRVYFANDWSSAGTTGGFNALGLVASSTAPVSGTAWTAVGGQARINAGAAASGNVPIALYTALASNTATTTVQVPNTQSQTHYYEIVGTPVAGTTNSFTIALYVDGSLQYTSAAVAMGSGTSDTTSVLIITFPRSQFLTNFDDIYFLVNDGTAPSGQQGPVYVAALRPNTDVQDQWVKNGTQTTNSLSVSQLGLSSYSGNFVSSVNAGDKDIYGQGGSNLPGGVSVKAVQIEGYFSNSVGAATTTVNLGLKNSTTEQDGSNATITTTTPVWVASQFAKDPSGAAWTSASAQAIRAVLNHVS